jgi:hemoglobin
MPLDRGNVTEALSAASELQQVGLGGALSSRGRVANRSGAVRRSNRQRGMSSHGMTGWTQWGRFQESAEPSRRQEMAELSLYDRLGGAFAIAAVVDHFSEAVVQNPIVGQKSENPDLREWHTNNLARLPGLKFMRTLWVCDVAGGPQQYAATKPGSTPLGLEEAHRELKISPAEFDEVAAELGRTLDFFKVPEREKEEVLAAFAAHKGEVTEGYSQ